MNALSVYQSAGKARHLVDAAVEALQVNSRRDFQRLLPELAVHGLYLSRSLSGQAFGVLVEMGSIRIRAIYSVVH